MSLGKAKAGIVISLISGIILGFISAGVADGVGENGLNVGHYLLFGLTGISFISMIIFSLFHNCPTCGRHLGRGTFFADFCPGCGNKLE